MPSNILKAFKDSKYFLIVHKNPRVNYNLFYARTNIQK